MGIEPEWTESNCWTKSTKVEEHPKRPSPARIEDVLRRLGDGARGARVGVEGDTVFDSCSAFECCAIEDFQDVNDVCSCLNDITSYGYYSCEDWTEMAGGGTHRLSHRARHRDKAERAPGMGFALGLHAGAVVGQFTLAALILKYGEITPQLIQEMKNILKQIACTACPEVKVEAKVEIKVNDCLKQDIVKFAKGGIDFCSKYQDGFKCAAAMIVMSLTKSEPPDPHVKVTPPTLTIACAEFKAE